MRRDLPRFLGARDTTTDDEDEWEEQDDWESDEWCLGGGPK